MRSGWEQNGRLRYGGETRVHHVVLSGGDYVLAANPDIQRPPLHPAGKGCTGAQARAAPLGVEGTDGEELFFCIGPPSCGRTADTGLPGGCLIRNSPAKQARIWG